MSWEMFTKVLDIPVSADFTSEEKFTLLIYANFAKADGSNSFPSIATVSRMTGYHERSVQRYKARLVASGFLVADGMGRGGTNRYKVIPLGGDSVPPPDIPSGDIPSGDSVPPKPNEPIKQLQQREREEDIMKSSSSDFARTKCADPAFSASLAFYAAEIGKPSPTIEREIKSACDLYSHEWVRDAITEAVLCNVPNLKYILAILTRWKSDGRVTKIKPKAAGKGKRAGRMSDADLDRVLGITV